MNESKLIPIIAETYKKIHGKFLYGKHKRLPEISITDSEMKKLMEENPGKPQYKIISEMAGRMGADMIFGFYYLKNGHDENEYLAFPWKKI